MSLIKDYILQKQEEEQELWDSYMDWVSENKDLFQQLPKNIQDLIDPVWEEEL